MIILVHGIGIGNGIGRSVADLGLGGILPLLNTSALPLGRCVHEAIERIQELPALTPGKLREGKQEFTDCG